MFWEHWLEFTVRLFVMIIMDKMCSETCHKDISWCIQFIQIRYWTQIFRYIDLHTPADYLTFIWKFTQCTMLISWLGLGVTLPKVNVEALWFVNYMYVQDVACCNEWSNHTWIDCSICQKHHWKEPNFMLLRCHLWQFYGECHWRNTAMHMLCLS